MERFFASDNNSGVHPQFLKAISEANKGHVLAYGDDIYTERAVKTFKNEFGNDTDIFFTFLGTGANVIGLKSITQSYHTIICAESAHIFEDECGAVENFSGAKLLPISSPNGKLSVDLIRPYIKGVDCEHHSQIKVISITQSTELGTVYTIDELKEITNFAHKNHLLVHMDGARISNAAVKLQLPFKAFTKDVGIDILSFGGTKNGMMYGEAILFFNQKLSQDFKYIRKQGMQLASKMRYISAQFECFFHNNLWKDLATQANKMAQILARKLDSIPEIKIIQKVDANGLFVEIPENLAKKIQDKYFFYEWDKSKNIYRWMCSWDTTEEDIQNFIEFIQINILEAKSTKYN